MIPSLEYSKRLHAEMVTQDSQGRAEPAASVSHVSALNPNPVTEAKYVDDKRAKLRMISNEMKAGADFGATITPDGTVTNMPPSSNDTSYTVQPSSDPQTRDYIGPLPLGDPGTTASLWRESRGPNEYFRDDRAWQAMDLLTIVVTEKSQATKEADTEVKSKSDVSAAISALLGLEKQVKAANPDVNPDNLVSATTKNDFKGEGDTSRKGSLTARISAMVVEVLPSGILRIEGEKIISVNSEEETMVISGLVRTQDITSNNEVDSAKIANMRIDYYGTGTVGDAQHGGWLGRAMKRFWPF